MNGSVNSALKRAMVAWGMLAALAIAAPPPTAALGEEPSTASGRRLRSIVLKKLPENTQIIGLEFTIVHVDANGVHKAVDTEPENYPFKIGDSFLLRIKPQDDVFVYVFTEGPDGKRSRLLPESPQRPLRVKADAAIDIPNDGNLFTFEAPAGEEKLLVVALREHNPNLLLIQEAAFQRGGQQLRSAADEAIDGIKKGVEDNRRMRGAKRQMVDRATAITPGSGRVQVEATPEREAPLTEVLGINTSELVVGISLHSLARGQRAP